jgi:hypothetical protein
VTRLDQFGRPMCECARYRKPPTPTVLDDGSCSRPMTAEDLLCDTCRGKCTPVRVWLADAWHRVSGRHDELGTIVVPIQAPYLTR